MYVEYVQALRKGYTAVCVCVSAHMYTLMNMYVWRIIHVCTILMAATEL